MTRVVEVLLIILFFAATAFGMYEEYISSVNVIEQIEAK